MRRTPPSADRLRGGDTQSRRQDRGAQHGRGRLGPALLVLAADRLVDPLDLVGIGNLLALDRPLGLTDVQLRPRAAEHRLVPAALDAAHRTDIHVVAIDHDPDRQLAPGAYLDANFLGLVQQLAVGGSEVAHAYSALGGAGWPTTIVWILVNSRIPKTPSSRP